MERFENPSQKASEESAAGVKVNYTPLEAAIRWSGLLPSESQISAALSGESAVRADALSAWPTLRLNAERILDAIENRELRYAVSGSPIAEFPSLNQNGLTIRHVDLKTWMKRFYPDQKPDFLFSAAERLEFPLTIDAVKSLLLQREALQSQIELRDQALRGIREKQTVSLRTHSTPDSSDASQDPLSPRRETTYLNIVGGLLNLLLGHSPSGQPYSSFRTQEAIVSALVAHYGDRLGMGERTLHGKFAAAKQTLGQR